MTRRPVIYMMHPLSAETADGIQADIQRALRWLAWLRRTYPAVTFIAPWISIVQSLDGDDSPELREAGLVDDCTVVERCDGAVAVGGRWSSGMQREAKHARAIVDLTWLMSAMPTVACFRKRIKFEGAQTMTANFPSVLVYSAWRPPAALRPHLWLSTYAQEAA